jgi:hypothetical protein
MAKDAYWFRHDANARNDIKIIELRSIHGYEGYGIYFAIIEVMREQTDYTISESKIGMVAVALGLPLDKLKPIMDDCISIGLFERRDGQILSQSLLNRMDTWDSYKNNGKKGGRPKKQPKDNQEDKPTNNQKHNLNGNQKVKLNDTIIVDRVNRDNGVNKNLSVVEVPTLEMCVQAAQMSGYTQEDGIGYFHFRNKDNFMVAKGTAGVMHPIRNWRSDMATAIRMGYYKPKKDKFERDADPNKDYYGKELK